MAFKNISLIQTTLSIVPKEYGKKRSAFLLCNAHTERIILNLYDCLNFPLPVANKAKTLEGSRWTPEQRRQKNIQRKHSGGYSVRPPPRGFRPTGPSASALCRPRVLDLCRRHILCAMPSSTRHWKKVLFE
ncbi:UNVERIFIED_CONTAM: hypothetical protein K2H54_048174 [Gekko kuhli]